MRVISFDFRWYSHSLYPPHTTAGSDTVTTPPLPLPALDTCVADYTVFRTTTPHGNFRFTVVDYTFDLNYISTRLRVTGWT